MMNRYLTTALFSITALLWLHSCSPITTAVPTGFASYSGKRHIRSVSPDKVVYSVRHVKNKPYAEFDFWREALPKRMNDAGYRIVGDTVVSVNNQKALLLEMATPLGEYDYSYMVMMSLKKKKILIAEAAGTVDQFRGHREQIVAALLKTSLK